jgi:hypothetical protein
MKIVDVVKLGKGFVRSKGYRELELLKEELKGERRRVCCTRFKRLRR